MFNQRHQIMAENPLPIRVVLLTNILLPYRVVLMKAFAPLLAEFKIFLSAKTEPDRKDKISWEGLDVTVQKSSRWTHRFRHVHAYEDMSHIHIPYDTVFQLARARPAVVISGEFGARTLLATLYCFIVRSTTLIVWATISTRTEATRGRARKLLRKLILSQVDGAFGNGKDTEEYLRGLGFRGPVFHVPYVVDNRTFEGASMVRDDNIHRLLVSGQLIDRKGILPFFRALESWARSRPHENVELFIAGDGPLRPQIETFETSPNFRVTFLGYLTQEQLAEAYHRVSICAFPTLADEWGVVVNEALCAGVPVLGSIHSQAVDELIREGYNGWRFDPTSPDSTNAGLTRALSATRETLNQMSENARESISGITPQSIARRMAKAIASLRES